MLNDFERQYNDFHRFQTILNDSTTIFIDFERFWTIVQRFSSILNDFERKYNDFHQFSEKKHDFERQYNYFHRFSQKQSTTIMFFCSFASGGAARIDFYCKTEKCIKNTYKIDSAFWVFKSPERASTVPICTPKIRKMGTAGEPADLPDFPETRHKAWCTTPGTLAPEVRMTVVLNKLPQIKLRISTLVVSQLGGLA